MNFGSRIKQSNENKHSGNQISQPSKGKNREAPKPAINFKQLHNIGNNIQMIKSNTCETEEPIQHRV